MLKINTIFRFNYAKNYIYVNYNITAIFMTHLKIKFVEIFMRQNNIMYVATITQHYAPHNNSIRSNTET